MKVYTEVNYIWKDNKLVQTDSKSFDYEGELTLCHTQTKRIGSKRFGRDVNIPHTHASVSTVVNKVKDTVSKGPGGDIGKVVNKVYGGDTKAAVTSVQETYKDFENSFNDTKDDVAEVLFNPVKKKLEDTATSIITANNSNNSDTNNLESNYHSGDSSASTEAGGYKKNTRSKQSRGQMNLTSSKRKSLLTS